RLAFDLAVWSKGGLPMLLVCEEAHRYAPATGGESFAPTRLALARIAKEGRKYGLSLALVTQRPSELDTTILSQCSTVVAMRLSTERDQQVMRANTHDGALDLLDFLPLLGDREAIVLGQGVGMPMRIKFADISAKGVPRNLNNGFSQSWSRPNLDRAGLEAIVLKCLSKKPEHRYQSMQELTEDFDKMLDGQLPDAVGEMMARSGGFNVPADFFKSSMPVPVPATPAGLGRGRSWPLIAGIASVTAAISIVIGTFAYSQYGTASTASTTPSASVTPPVTTSPSATASPTPPVTTAQPAPETVDVMVVVDPVHAEVFLGDKALGVAPSLISVPKGQTVSVTVRATGYIEQTLVLDGSEKRKGVTL
ncbi:MAG: hypothetical protein CVT71_02710, partial [Alphaproteobacteria bacterium HGW-Alphaproteobacteria-10]